MKLNQNDNSEDNCRSLHTLTKGDLLGEIEFFSGKVTSINAVSKNVVTTALITKTNFVELLKEFP